MTNELIDQKPENPPAFPRPFSEDNHSKDIDIYHHSQEGMTLRDYFAAAAMPAHINILSDADARPRDWYEVVAERCYLTADAMLKARG